MTHSSDRRAADRSAREAVLSASHPPTALRVEAVEELDSDEVVPVPGIEHVTRRQLRTTLVVAVILLYVAPSPLFPVQHFHHMSWWNPLGF